MARLVIPDGSGVDVAWLDVGSLGVDCGALVQEQGVSPLAAMRSLEQGIRPTMHDLRDGGARGDRLPPRRHRVPPEDSHDPHSADALGIPHVVIESVQVAVD
ncbi:hypothetical protein [Agromyces bauzanensis]